MDIRHLTAAAHAYVGLDADALSWAHYGPGSEDEGDLPDCDVMSARLARHLGAGRVVMLDEDEPLAGRHWVAVFDTDDGAVAVDLTARQFHNVDGFEVPVATIPCPLVYRFDGGHPLPACYRLREIDQSPKEDRT